MISRFWEGRFLHWRIRFFALPSARRRLHPLARELSSLCLFSPPVTLPPLGLRAACFPLTGMLLITLGPPELSRIISPFKILDLPLQSPFVRSGNVFPGSECLDVDILGCVPEEEVALLYHLALYVLLVKNTDGALLPRKHFHDVSFLFLLNKTNKDYNKTDGSFPFHPDGWEAQWHWNLIAIISMLKFKCAYFIIFLSLILYNLILLVLLL